MSVTGPNGRVYNIPSVYDGRILHPDDAIKRAQAIGWEQFPSYGSVQDAEARYQQMHQYFDQDVQGFQALQRQLHFSGPRP
jgi:hypothetical protein